MKSRKGTTMERIKRIDNWIVEKHIADGNYGIVYKVKHKESGKIAAMKMIDIKSIHRNKKAESTRESTEDDTKKRVLHEIEVLRKLDHPNIIHFYEVIERDHEIYIIMEFATNGDLYDYIISKKQKYLSEDEARHFFRQLISAVDYSHANFVIHRDLKLENLLVNKDKTLKVADFGFSKIIEPGYMLNTHCGSIHYTAPEIISGDPYVGIAADIWSMGIILFAMLCGYLPFSRANNDFNALYNLAINRDYRIDSSCVSSDAENLIDLILEPNPYKRISVEDIRFHPWVTKYGYLGFPPRNLCTYDSVIEPDKEIVAKLCYFGFTPNDIVEKVRLGIACQEVTMYHTLYEKQKKKRIVQKRIRRMNTPSYEDFSLRIPLQQRMRSYSSDNASEKTQKRKPSSFSKIAHFFNSIRGSRRRNRPKLDMMDEGKEENNLTTQSTSFSRCEEELSSSTSPTSFDTILRNEEDVQTFLDFGIDSLHSSNYGHVQLRSPRGSVSANVSPVRR